MMQNQPNQKPVLIYFNARGIAQMIRLVLFQIGVEFQEVFVTCCGYLDPQIAHKYNIDIKCLPYLIHNGIALTGIFPIVKYLCLQFQRPDLLGRTKQDQIHIAQIMVKQLRQKGVMLHTLFKGLREVHQKNLGQEGIASLKIRMMEITCNKQLLPLIQMYNITQQFLFGYLTIVDFLYYDKSFYGTNFFNFNELPIFANAKKYLDFFKSTQFYKKNQKRIEQYKVFFPETDCTINMLIKKMWIGDPSYIGYQKD